jgi:GPI mannosyltransferase 3
VDHFYYGVWTFVPWNFVKFNVFQSGSEIYGKTIILRFQFLKVELGTHSFHWYFTQGFPAMLSLFTPLFILGVYLTKCFEPFILIIWTLFIYSRNPHKEFRFVLPVLPLAFMYCGYALNWIKYRKSILQICSRNLDMQKEKGKVTSHFFVLVVCSLVFFNVPMILYFSLIHQRAPISVISFIADEKNSVKSAHFLTGCHATPFYSHVHRNIELRQLDCSPR